MRLSDSRVSVRTAHASIVHQHIEPTALVQHFFDKLLPHPFIGDIHENRHGLPAVGSDSRLDALQPFFFDVDHVHFRTLLGNHLRFHLALTARRARNNSHLALELPLPFGNAWPPFGLSLSIDSLFEFLLARPGDNSLVEKL